MYKIQLIVYFTYNVSANEILFVIAYINNGHYINNKRITINEQYMIIYINNVVINY